MMIEKKFNRGVSVRVSVVSEMLSKIILIILSVQHLFQHLKELKHQNRAQKKEIDREDLQYTEKSSQVAYIENGLQYIFDIFMVSFLIRWFSTTYTLSFRRPLP